MIYQMLLIPFATSTDQITYTMLPVSLFVFGSENIYNATYFGTNIHVSNILAAMARLKKTFSSLQPRTQPAIDNQIGSSGIA
mmetsp:Transcript_20646/g.42990  ORF Transcript_20646/g.42990 Transcript_20646/m.42990 type:complete len:82 (+) Transcript_20646:46-291(+)